MTVAGEMAVVDVVTGWMDGWMDRWIDGVRKTRKRRLRKSSY